LGWVLSVWVSLDLAFFFFTAGPILPLGLRRLGCSLHWERAAEIVQESCELRAQVVPLGAVAGEDVEDCGFTKSSPRPGR
jgi:hypothetical protein